MINRIEKGFADETRGKERRGREGREREVRRGRERGRKGRREREEIKEEETKGKPSLLGVFVFTFCASNLSEIKGEIYKRVTKMQKIRLRRQGTKKHVKNKIDKSFAGQNCRR